MIVQWCWKAPERISKWGAPAQNKVGWGTDPPQSAPKKFFFGHAPPLFGSKSTISRFGERFRDGQYSLVSFLFAVLLLTVPRGPVPSHLLKWGHVPPVPCEVGATVIIVVSYVELSIIFLKLKYFPS